jgi:hypothetical protein
VEDEDAAPEDDVGVADHQPGEVDGQEAAAAEGGRRAEGEDADGPCQHGVEPRSIQVDAVDQHDAEAAEGEADHRAHPHLEREEGEHPRADRQPAEHHLDEGDGEEDRHRVVGPALYLQCRAQPLAQVQPLVTEGREDGGRVGRGHDAAEQHPVDERKTEDPGGEDAGDAGGEDDADRRHDRRRAPGHHHGAEWRAQPAVVEDQPQRDRAHRVGHLEVVEGDAADPLRPRQHPHRQEEHQHGHAHPAGKLAGEHAEDHEDPGDQEELVNPEHEAGFERAVRILPRMASGP